MMHAHNTPTTRIRRAARRTVATCVAAATVVLVGCPEPLSGDYLLEATDEQSPVISVTSPETNSNYFETVTVAGSVQDESNASGNLPNLVYQIVTSLGTTDDINVSVAGDGSFSFSFDTVGYDGDIGIVVTATDWNGNSATQRITLKDPGVELPSFAAQVGSQTIQLTWNDVVGAESYDVYYTDNGSVPSAVYGEQLLGRTSPVSLAGLRNGNQYVFRLIANMSDGSTLESDALRTIPLSGLTVVPRSSAVSSGIRIDWPAIPGSDSFEVFRTDNAAGSELVNISGEIERNFFVDTQVSDGTVYSYAIRPSLAGAGISESISATTIPVPDGVFTPFGQYRDMWTVGDALAVGNTLYVARELTFNEAGEILILDANDPRDIKEIGSFSDTGDPQAMVRDGNYLYVAVNNVDGDKADGDNFPGIEIYDISTPTAPAFVSSYEILSNGDISGKNVYATDVVYANNTVFLAAGGYGIYMIDVTSRITPSQDTYIYDGTMSPGLNAGALYAAVPSGGTGYLWVAGEGDPGKILYSFQVNYGAMPSLSLYAYNSFGFETSSYTSLTRIGDRLYLGADTFYRWVYPGGSPDSPSSSTGTWVHGNTSSLPANIGGNDLVVTGDVLFSVGSTVGVQGTLSIMDVTDPSSPVLVGSRVASTSVPPRDAAFTSDGYLMAVSADGVISYDTSDVYNPTVVTDVSPGAGNVTAVFAAGNRLYAGTDTGGLFAYDISTPTAPSRLFSTDIGTTVTAIRATDTTIVAAGGTSGVYVGDIGDTAFTERSTTNTDSTANDVAIWNDLVLVANGTDGAMVINIANPDAPVIEASERTLGTAYGVATDGEYMYIGNDGTEDLLVFDPFSNPGTLALIGSVDDTTVDRFYKVTIVDDVLFGSTGNDGISALDISDPTNPSAYGEPHPLSLDSSQNFLARAVAVPNGLIAADNNGIVYRADTSEENVIVGVGRTDLTESLAGALPNDLAVAGSYAYVATDAGLVVVNLSQ